MASQLPENFAVGSAVDGADCFFHSVVKCLHQLNQKNKPLSVKVLRLACKQYARMHLNQGESWMKDLLTELENVSLQGYQRRIEFSAKDIGTDKAASLNMTEAICGRPEIEGRIICDLYDVKLHVIEEDITEECVLTFDPKRDKDGSESGNGKCYNEKGIAEPLLPDLDNAGDLENNDNAMRDEKTKTWCSMMVDKLSHVYVDHVDYEADDTIHVLKLSKNLYKPILRESLRDGSSDEEKTSKQMSYKLSAIVRGKMSEEKMLKQMKVFLDKGADIDFKDRNDRCNTVLHIAVRKRKLRVVKFLVENNANVHLKNMENISALEYAEQIKRCDIVDILRNERKMQNEFVTNDRSQDLKEKNQFTFIRPSDDSGVSGQRYEVNLLTLFKLRGERITDDFCLAGNLSEAGDFDDVVFKYWSGNVSKVIFLQAKHRQDTRLRKIDHDTFKTDKDFDLQKYFKSYMGVKDVFQKETGSPIFRGEFDKAYCEFAILTNSSLGSNRNSVILQETGNDSFEIGKGGKAIKLDPDYGFELLTSKENAEHISFLTKKFIDFVMSGKKDSVMASDDVVKEYHVFWAQRVLEIDQEIHVKSNRKLKPGDKGKGFRYAKLCQEFLQGPIENDHMRQFRNEVVKALQKAKLLDKVITIPEEFGNVGPAFNLIHSVDNLCGKFVELFSQSQSVDNTCVISKVNDRKLFKDLGKLVGSVLVLNENTGFLKLNDKELEGEAKEVLDHLVDTMKRNGLHPGIEFDFQIPGFPKLLLSYRSKTENDKRDFIKKLTVYTDQPSVKELDDVIKKEIKSFYHLTDDEVDSNALRINDKMTRYWLETGSVAFLRKGDGVLGDVVRKVIHVHAMMPLDSFTGRVPELQELHELLQSDELRKTCEMVIIYGLGGVGKSELARKYVSDYGVFYDHNIVWIHADNSASLQYSFRQLCQNSLNIPVNNDNGSQRNMKCIFQDIHSFFAQRKCLFIFDNAENFSEGENEIERFLKQSGSENKLKPSVIITSRNSNWQSGKMLPLGAFSDDEAEEFVKASLKIGDSQNSEIKTLINLLQNFPLALQQAVAFIREKDSDCRISCSNSAFKIGDYIRLFEEKTQAMMDFKFPEDSLDYYTHTIYNTWNITFETFRQLWCGREAMLILYVMAYCNPYNIPVQLFQVIPEPEPGTVNQALQLLKQYALITLDDGMANIHILVQNVCRVRLRAVQEEVFALSSALQLLWKCHTKKEIIALGVSVWNYAVSYDDLVRDFWHIPAQIMTGLEKNARYQEAYSFGLGALESLKSKLGNDHPAIVVTEEQLANALSYMGRYEESVTSLSLVLERIASIMGHNHPLLLSAKNIMAVTLNKQGKCDEALALLEDLLKESTDVFGSHHKFTLTVKQNTAETLYNQCRYEEALEIFTEVFEKKTSILGPDNKSTLTSHHNVVSILAAQFKPEALDMCKNVFVKMTKKFGSHHPKTLSSQILLANALLHQDKYVEALISYKDVYQKTTKIYGNDHQETVAVLNNIAIALSSQGNYNAAISTYKEMLEQEIKILGPDHPSTLCTQCNVAAMQLLQGDSGNVQSFKDAVSKLAEKLGSCHPDTLHFQIQVVQSLRIQGHDEEASRYSEGLSEKCASVHGPNHPATLSAEIEFAVAVRSRGQFKEALSSFRNILAKMAGIFGPENKYTLDVEHHIGDTLSYQGKYEEALSVFEELIPKLTKILGSDHPHVLMTLDSKATVLHKQGKYKECIDTCKDALQEMQIKLGSDHPNIWRCQSTMAVALHEQGNYSEALSIANEVYNERLKKHGPDHPKTLNSQNTIAQMKIVQGQHEEGYAIMKEVFEKHVKVFGPDHLDTLLSRRYMATAQSKMGKHDEALCCYKELLEKRTQILGPNHPDTVDTQSDIAQAMFNAGKYEEALSSYKEVLEKLIKIFGVEHPKTLRVQSQMASALCRQGKYDDAFSFYKDVFEKRMRILGPDHPDTLAAQNNMNQILNDVNKREQVLTSLDAGLRKRTDSLGCDNLETLNTQKNMALALARQGRCEEALQCYRDLLEKQIKLAVPDHIAILNTRRSIALQQSRLGKPETVQSLKDVLEQSIQMFGPNFEATIMDQMHVAQTLTSLGQHDEASKYNHDLIEKFTRVIGPDHLLTLRAECYIAFSMHVSGKREEAVRAFEVLLEKCIKVLGSDHSFILTVQQTMAQAMFSRR